MLLNIPRGRFHFTDIHGNNFILNKLLEETTSSALVFLEV